MSIRHGLDLGKTAAAWSLRRYLRHFWPIAGLSMIPAIQRFWLVSQSGDIAAPIIVTTEVVAQGSRLLLVWLLVKLILTDDDVLGPLSPRERWGRLTAFIDAHGSAFATQFGILAVAFLSFDTLPNVLITTMVPIEDRESATAVAVAVKNPTVIAWTFIWMVGLGRFMMRHGGAPYRARNHAAHNG